MQFRAVSKCPYLSGKPKAKICKNNNSIYKVISALELHVSVLDPAELAHDLAEKK